MREVVILSGVRTAIGTFGGTLQSVSASDLGAIVIKESVRRARIDQDAVDEVIMGNVLQAGQGQNPARQAALKARLSTRIPAMTVNKVCGSSLKAVILATQAIMSGDAEVVVAGGMENMDLAPYVLDKARYGYRMGHGELLDSMITDGLWCVFGDSHMGITAENLGEIYNITRDEQDDFAARSQQKAEQAISAGRFKEEIVKVDIPQRKGDPIVFCQDEHPRPGITKEKLTLLKPAFKRDGTVTPGNASGINDGAAALIIASKDKAARLGLKPMATIRAYASAGVDPSVMGIGPVPATRRALERADLRIEDLDLIEANEAFAVQCIAVGRELGWDPDKVNVNGGAIALGHPIGASGARILVSLLHEMVKRELRLGLATLCVGGGMGLAVIVER